MNNMLCKEVFRCSGYGFDKFFIFSCMILFLVRLIYNCKYVLYKYDCME